MSPGRGGRSLAPRALRGFPAHSSLVHPSLSRSALTRGALVAASLLLALPAGGFAAPTPERAVRPSIQAALDRSGFEVPDELGIFHYRLENGLNLVVAVRPGLRLAAVNLTVGLGSVDDPPGFSGMAHVLEHVTLAGSQRLGSVDLEREHEALEQLDRAFESLRTARRSGQLDPRSERELEAEVHRLRLAAAELAEKGEILGARLEARGAIGLNATTSPDATQYFGRLPVNQVGYWLELEADRLRHPILRRFHSERDVVLREIDTLTGGRPTAQEKLLGEAVENAAGARPMANPVAGTPAEIRDFDRHTTFEHYHRAYRPENIVISVVGDVQPGQVRALCERHFGSWHPASAAAPEAAPEVAPEPPAQAAEAGATEAGDANPAARQPYVRGFNSTRSPLVFLGFPAAEPGTVDEAIELALAELLGSEQLSPLHADLVRGQERRQPLAWSVGAASPYPSEKVDALFLVHLYGVPGTEHGDLYERARSLLPELGEADDSEIRGAIAQAQMSVIEGLEDPARLASLLALHQAIHGTWQTPFLRLMHLSRLRPANLRRHAARLFDFEAARVVLPETRGRNDE